MGADPSKQDDIADRIAARIAALRLGHPVRVAVDGRTAAGKTTFGGGLARAVRRAGRPALSLGIDGFHAPRAVRYARGRTSPEGYYHDARDLGAVRARLLEPLGPGGHRRIVRETFDLAADRALAPEAETVPLDGVVIVDGTFLQRPELHGLWDYIVYLDIPAELSLERGARRDADRLGGLEAARAVYAARYLPGFALYRAQLDPVAGADAVVDMADFAAPALIFRESS